MALEAKNGQLICRHCDAQFDRYLDALQTGDDCPICSCPANKLKKLLADCSTICTRLLDSEEHAVESAVPQVAEDAAELIQRLSDELANRS